MHNWEIEFFTDFLPEFEELPLNVRLELLAHLKVLQIEGPLLGRPLVDTLKNSKHSNMKELRFQANDGVWRVAFAFDPERKAIILVVGDKVGTSERLFYKQLIKKADKRFDKHLFKLTQGDKNI
jgi:hypothetical protein